MIGKVVSGGLGKPVGFSVKLPKQAPGPDPEPEPDGTPVDLVITVHGASNGANVTPTMLAARQLGTWSGSSYKYTNDVVPESGHVLVTNAYDLAVPVPYKIGGTPVPEITQGIIFDTAGFSSSASFQMDYPAGVTEYAASCIFHCSFNTPAGLAQEMDVGGGYDLYTLCVQLGRKDAGGTLGDYKPHSTPAPANGAGIRIYRTSAKDYVFWRVKNGRFMMYVLDEDWNFVGASSVDRAGGDIVNKLIQDYLGPAHGQTDRLVYGPIYMNTTSVPLYHGTAPTIPTPTSVAASVTGAGEITLTWTSPVDRFKIEKWNGSAWSTAEEFYVSASVTNLEAGTTWKYVESGLSDGTVRKYRVTARFGDDAANCLQSAASSESNPITITEPQPGPGVTLKFSQGGNDDGSINFKTYFTHSTEFTLSTGFDITRAEHRVYIVGTLPAGTIKAEIWTKVGSNPGTKLYESSAINRTTIPTSSYQWVSFPGFVGTLSPGTYFFKLRVSAYDTNDSNCMYLIRTFGSQLYRSSNDDSSYDNTGPMVGNIRLYAD